MMLAVATLCFAVALLLSGTKRIAGPTGARFARLVPERVAATGSRAKDVRHQWILHRGLTMLDPTFAGTEALLRSLGVTRLSWIIAAEIGKLAGATLTAAGVAAFAGAVIHTTAVVWIAPPLAFALFIFFANQTIKSAASKRRKRVRRELALGMELLCIFLEGGQSLDQAFRSFCDACGDALPHIAAIQRGLVADLNNGTAYEKAIETWAEKLHVDEAKPLATLFVDSLVHGTELVPHLRQFARELIEQRIALARESIGVKSSQLSAVMVAFFLPTILAFIAAPAITGILTALEK